MGEGLPPYFESNPFLLKITLFIRLFVTMAKAFLFHNPRCSKSRQALNLLEKEKENFEVFMYLDEKLEKDFLKEIIQKLGMSPRDLLRTGESAYKENNLKDSNISEEEIINLMIEYPKLIERPIYVKGSKAIVGRPPENVLKII